MRILKCSSIFRAMPRRSSGSEGAFSKFVDGGFGSFMPDPPSPADSAVLCQIRWLWRIQENYSTGQVRTPRGGGRSEQYPKAFGFGGNHRLREFVACVC